MEKRSSVVYFETTSSLTENGDDYVVLLGRLDCGFTAYGPMTFHEAVLFRPDDDRQMLKLIPQRRPGKEDN